MSKFETVGVQNLEEAATKRELNKAFQWSCRCCCNKGMHLDCDRCTIKVVHGELLAIMDDMESMRNSGQLGEAKKK